jgi:hypothetical protein
LPCTQLIGNSWYVSDYLNGHNSNVHAVGSVVAVEGIFLGGRDTILLRRASLQPETICTLMLVKQKLRLGREGRKS